MHERCGIACWCREDEESVVRKGGGFWLGVCAMQMHERYGVMCWF